MAEKHRREADLNRSWVLRTVLALLLLTSAGVLHARGVQENRLAQAQKLFDEANYNDAMLILAQVVREEPDRLDEAQDLIRRIVEIRNKFNVDYEKLIQLLYEQKDEETSKQVIAQLETLDKNPNKRTADAIKQAKRTARLIANNKRYADIIGRARAALGRQEYGNAAKIYLEGQDLAKDMFLESGFGNVLTNQVDRSWEDLKAATALFVEAEARLKALPAQGRTLLAAEAASPAFDALLASMRDLAAWRQRAWADGRLFKAQNEFLVKNDRQPDFFLDYSYLFVNGPADAKDPEGILGAVDRMWAEVLDPWTAQVQTGVEARYAEAKAALEAGNWTVAASAFEGLRIRSRQGMDVITLWNRISGIDGTGALDAAYKAKLGQILPLGLWLDRRLTLAVEGAQAARALPRGTTLVAATSLTDRAALEAARAEVRDQKNAFDAFAKTVSAWNPQRAVLTGLGYALADPASFGTQWQETWSSYRQKAQAQEAGFVDKRGTLDYGLLDGRFTALQTALTDARTLVEGTLKYPLQATAKLQDLKPLQDVLAKDIGGFIALYDGEVSDVKTEAVLRWPVRGRDLLARLAAAQGLQGQLLVAAQANYAQSQVLKKQGQDGLPQVDTLLTAENFTQARAVVNTASTRFSQSLALQEDPGFRTDSDTQIKALFDKILKAENEVVVRDVRRLITQGSQAYLGQQFTQAEQILTRAKARWAVTNTDPNSEVEYWLTLATYALSVTTGRELSPIDPLYNEVQQLLNFARRDFTLGQEKIDAGDKEGGLALMASAKEVLSKILLPFPLNQEARLLNLSILKASDPGNFPALFKQNFDTAVGRIPREPSLAYNDLLDLDKIQPNYPGMEAAIKQVRQKLNLDRPPTDTTAVQKAKTIVAQAARLVTAGGQAQLTQAKALLAQALQLDPANTTAQELSDQINLRLGSTVGVKTPTIIQELNDINDLLRSQRTLEALSRMTQFKAQYPNLVGDAQVKELDRRIRAVN